MLAHKSSLASYTLLVMRFRPPAHSPLTFHISFEGLAKRGELLPSSRVRQSSVLYSSERLVLSTSTFSRANHGHHNMHLVREKKIGITMNPFTLTLDPIIDLAER